MKNSLMNSKCPAINLDTPKFFGQKVDWEISTVMLSRDVTCTVFRKVISIISHFKKQINFLHKNKCLGML